MAYPKMRYNCNMAIWIWWTMMNHDEPWWTMMNHDEQLDLGVPHFQTKMDLPNFFWTKCLWSQERPGCWGRHPTSLEGKFWWHPNQWGNGWWTVIKYRWHYNSYSIPSVSDSMDVPGTWRSSHLPLAALALREWDYGRTSGNQTGQWNIPHL